MSKKNPIISSMAERLEAREERKSVVTSLPVSGHSKDIDSSKPFYGFSSRYEGDVVGLEIVFHELRGSGPGAEIDLIVQDGQSEIRTTLPVDGDKILFSPFVMKPGWRFDLTLHALAQEQVAADGAWISFTFKIQGSLV